MYSLLSEMDAATYTPSEEEVTDDHLRDPAPVRVTHVAPLSAEV